MGSAETRPRDRKRLLRALIPQPDPTLARIGIRWHTGATDQRTLTRPGPGKTPPAALALIRRLGATHTSQGIAAQLNAAGPTTGKHRPFTAAGVAQVRDSYQIRAPRTVPLRPGEITVADAAGRLGISADAIYNWLANGQTPDGWRPATAGASGGMPRPRRCIGPRWLPPSGSSHEPRHEPWKDPMHTTSAWNVTVTERSRPAGTRTRARGAVADTESRAAPGDGPAEASAPRGCRPISVTIP